MLFGMRWWNVFLCSKRFLVNVELLYIFPFFFWVVKGHDWTWNILMHSLERLTMGILDIKAIIKQRQTLIIRRSHFFASPLPQPYKVPPAAMLCQLRAPLCFKCCKFWWLRTSWVDGCWINIWMIVQAEIQSQVHVWVWWFSACKQPKTYCGLYWKTVRCQPKPCDMGRIPNMNSGE